MPSPTFWKTWRRVVNGAVPSQDAPSPPIWVKPVVSRPIQVAMKWQPIPATALLPSGTLVEELCGQPGQNQGSRTSAGGAPASVARRRSSSGRRALSVGSSVRATIRSASATATPSVSSWPCEGKRMSPRSSRLPRTLGRSGSS